MIIRYLCQSSLLLVSPQCSVPLVQWWRHVPVLHLLTLACQSGSLCTLCVSLPTASLRSLCTNTTSRSRWALTCIQCTANPGGQCNTVLISHSSSAFGPPIICCVILLVLLFIFIVLVKQLGKGIHFVLQSFVNQFWITRLLYGVLPPWPPWYRVLW